MRMRETLLGLLGGLLLSATLSIELAYATNCGTGTGTCFALTGNTNVGTSWSDTDGGANCNATCASGPAAGDACILTSNSGALTINASLSCSSFNACAITGTAAYASTLTHNTAVVLTVSSNDAGAPAGGIAFCLPASTYSTASGRVVTFTAAAGTVTITTNANSIGAVTLNGAAPDFTLGGALTVLGTLTFTDGVLITNNNAVSVSTFSSNNANTRTLTLGSSTVTITGTTGNVWDFGTTTNLTMTASTSTIDFNATATGRRQWLGGTITVNNVSVTNPVGNAYAFAFSMGGGTFTCANLTLTNLRNLRIDTGTHRVTGTLTYNGTSSAPGYVESSGLTNGTIQLDGANTTSWVFPQNINRTGAGSWTANNSYDMGGNGGTIAINAPAGGASVHCIGC